MPRLPFRVFPALQRYSAIVVLLTAGKMMIVGHMVQWVARELGLTMDIFSPLLGAAFGIGLVAGLLHLVLGLGRPRSPVHLFFGAASLLWSIQALAALGMIHATTFDQYLAIFKYGYGPTSALGVLALLWFVTFYTAIQPTRFLWVLTAVWLALPILHILLPTGILTNIVAIERVTLPWGEVITVHQGAPTALQPFVVLSLLAVYGFFAYALWRQWQRGERVAVLLVALPLVVFVLVTTIHGRLVDAGAIDSPYLGAVSMIALSLPLSLRMAQEAVFTRKVLQEREQQLRAFVSHTEEGIWTVDFARPLSPDLPAEEQVAHVQRYANRFSESNEAMARILGYDSRKALIGQHVFDVFPRALVGNEALWQQIVDSRFRVTNLIGLARGQNGRERYLESSLTPILEDGKVVRVWGTSRDVTERRRTAEELRQYRDELEEMVDARTEALQKANDRLSREVIERAQAEEALRYSRQFARSILDSLPHQIVVLDETGTILEVNLAWRRNGLENGLTWENGGVGRDYLEVLDRAAGDGAEPTAAAAAAGIRAVLGGERDSFLLEYACHTPNRRRWFLMVVTRFPTPDARAVIAHHDITERKLAEKAAQEREALLGQVLDLLPVGVWITDATGQIVSGNPAGLQIWGGARYVSPEEFDQYKAWRVDSGERIAAGEWAAARAITRGEVTIREFIEIEAFDGSRKFLLNSAVPLRDNEEEIFGAVIVNEDISARWQVEKELEQRVEQLWTLHEIAVMVAALSDLPQGLPRVAEVTTELFNVDATHFIFTETGEEELTLSGYERGAGPLAPTELGLPLADLVVTRQVLQEKHTFTTTPTDPVETTGSVAAFLQARNIASFMLVPLVVAGETLGVMAVNSAVPDRAFTADEVRLAETIAAKVAAAVANLHLLAQTRETAALQERQRIASELHDSVTQTIYSVSIMAQTVPRLVREGKLMQAERNATQMRLTTLGALAQMRALLFELRPTALAEARLGVLLQQLGDAFTGQTRVPVDLVVKGDAQPPADVKIAFYRIAQEAFNNIAKHAQATQVAVALHSAADALKMTIADDGQGFEMATNLSGQMGLRIMGERAESVGAELALESHPGQGTSVTLLWKAG